MATASDVIDLQHTPEVLEHMGDSPSKDMTDSNISHHQESSQEVFKPNGQPGLENSSLTTDSQSDTREGTEYQNFPLEDPLQTGSKPNFRINESMLEETNEKISRVSETDKNVQILKMSNSVLPSEEKEVIPPLVLEKTGETKENQPSVYNETASTEVTHLFVHEESGSIEVFQLPVDEKTGSNNVSQLPVYDKTGLANVIRSHNHEKTGSTEIIHPIVPKENGSTKIIQLEISQESELTEIVEKVISKEIVPSKVIQPDILEETESTVFIQTAFTEESFASEVVHPVHFQESCSTPVIQPANFEENGSSKVIQPVSSEIKRSTGLIKQDSSGFNGSTGVIKPASSEVNGSPKIIKSVSSEVNGSPKIIKSGSSEVNGSPKIIQSASSEVNESMKIIQTVRSKESLLNNLNESLLDSIKPCSKKDQISSPNRKDQIPQNNVINLSAVRRVSTERICDSENFANDMKNFSLLQENEFKNGTIFFVSGASCGGHVTASPSPILKPIFPDFKMPPMPVATNVTTGDSQSPAYDSAVPKDKLFKVSLCRLLSSLVDWVNTGMDNVFNRPKTANIGGLLEYSDKKLLYGLTVLKQMDNHVQTLLKAVAGLPDPPLPCELSGPGNLLRERINGAGSKVRRSVEVLKVEITADYDKFVTVCRIAPELNKEDFDDNQMEAMAVNIISNSYVKVSENFSSLKLEIENFRNFIRDFYLDISYFL